MIILKYVEYAVLVLSYVGIGLGYLPDLRMNRATIALVKATFLVILGVVNFKEAWGAINYKTHTAAKLTCG